MMEHQNPDNVRIIKHGFKVECLLLLLTNVCDEENGSQVNGAIQIGQAPST